MLNAKWSIWRITLWITIVCFFVLLVPYVMSSVEPFGSGGWGLTLICLWVTLLSLPAVMIDNTILIVRLYRNRISNDFFIATLGINVVLFLLALVVLAILMRS